MHIDANQIVPRLWQGSEPPQGWHLRRLGVDVLVLCAMEFQPPATKFPGVKVIHAPMNDSEHVPVEEAKRAAFLASREHGRGSNVLVCCHMGINRSGLVTALILWLRTGCPGWWIDEKILAARPQALQNQYFRNFVLGLPGRRR